MHNSKVLLLLLCFLLAILPNAALAAFPSIAAEGADTADTDGTTTAVNMPSGISAGDLLIVNCAHDSGTLLTQSGGSDWTRLWAAANSTVVSGAIFGKIAAGSDTLTVAGAAQDTACNSRRITGHGVTNVSVDILLGTASTGTSATPNPPSVTHGGPQDYLVLSHVSSDDDDNSATPCPASYSLANQTESAQSASSTMVDVCSRAINGTSEDPGNGALAASEEWIAQTISIPPALGTEYSKATDNFNRADENPLSGGGNWVVPTTFTTNLLASNVIGPSALAECANKYTNVTITDNQWVKGTITTWTAGNERYVGVIARGNSGTGDTFYFAYASANRGDSVTAKIKKDLAGTISDVVTTTVPTWAVNDVIKLVLIGTRLTLYQNTTSVLTGIDSSISGGTVPGIYTTPIVATSDVRMDNWDTGDYTAPTGACSGAMLLLGVGC